MATEDGATLHEKILDKLSGPSEDIAEPEEQTEPDQSEDVEVEEETESAAVEEVAEETHEVEEEDAIDLSELADYIGFDQEKLDVNESGELRFKTKIDGEEGSASLEQLIKSYQLEGHLNKQNMEVAELKKKLTSQLEESKNQVNEKLKRAEDIAQIVYSELMKDYESIDWNGLRNEDPAEWSAKQEEFRQRQNRIAQAYQDIQSAKVESKPDPVALEDTRKQEQHRLVQAMGWKDEETMNKDLSQIQSYSEGIFSEDERNNLGDHRIFVLLSKAAKYDALQKETPRITNKVRKAPKLVKPGSKTPKTIDKTAELKKTVRKEGTIDSVAAYLLNSGKV